MSVTQGNGVCPALLVALDDINPKQANLVTPIGFTQSLFDPNNRNPKSVIQDQTGGTGHLKTVRIAYKQRAILDDIVDVKDCEDGETRPYLEDTFAPTLYSQRTVRIDEADVRVLCEAHSNWVKLGGSQSKDPDGSARQLELMSEIVMEILMDLDPLRRKINQNLLTAYDLKRGTWQGGDDFKSFQMYRTTNTTGLEAGSVVPDGFNKMRQAIMESSYQGKPLTFGNGNIYNAVSSLGYGCCNLGGVDISQMQSNAGFNFYADVDAPTILGDVNDFGIYMPGSLQFASYNEYVGNFARPIGTMERGTFPDPFVPGLSYDVRIKVSECGEYYSAIFGLHYDLWAAPTDKYRTGDRLAGTNGAFLARATAA